MSKKDKRKGELKEVKDAILAIRLDAGETREDIRAVFGEIRHLKGNHLEHVQGSLDELNNNQELIWTKIKSVESRHKTDNELNKQDHDWIKKLLWWVLGLLAASGILGPIIGHYW